VSDDRSSIQGRTDTRTRNSDPGNADAGDEAEDGAQRDLHDQHGHPGDDGDCGGLGPPAGVRGPQHEQVDQQRHHGAEQRDPAEEGLDQAPHDRTDDGHRHGLLVTALAGDQLPADVDAETADQHADDERDEAANQSHTRGQECLRDKSIREATGLRGGRDPIPASGLPTFFAARSDHSDMDTRELGSTGMDVTEIGLGTWNVGPSWGEASDEECRDSIRAALDAGANVIDTAEVYGDGRAERLIGEVLDEYDKRVFVPTKAAPDEDERHSEAGLRESVAGSKERLGVDSLDLVQLHCPETAAFYEPETFDALEALKAEGEIDHAGVSVEKVEEATKAIEYDVVETVQIIFNPLRLRPAERFFERAKNEDVGVIVRVPLASGLLADAFEGVDDFGENDHRRWAAEDGVEAGVGRKGGETFAGVPFEDGLAAVADMRRLVPADATMAQFTLRWVLDFDAVSTVIPGSTSPGHVEENVAAADLDPLSHETHGAVQDIYEEHVEEYVHHRW